MHKNKVNHVVMLTIATVYGCLKMANLLNGDGVKNMKSLNIANLVANVNITQQLSNLKGQIIFKKKYQVKQLKIIWC